MNWPNHAIQAIHIRTDTVVAHASIITNLRLVMTDERVYGGIQNKIKGLPTIKQCKVLANRRNILTKYSNGTIAMFDVFTGEKGNALYLRYDFVSYSAPTWPIDKYESLLKLKFLNRPIGTNVWNNANSYFMFQTGFLVSFCFARKHTMKTTFQQRNLNVSKRLFNGLILSYFKTLKKF